MACVIIRLRSAHQLAPPLEPTTGSLVGIRAACPLPADRRPGPTVATSRLLRPAPLRPRLRAFGEEIADGHFERLGDVEEPFVEKPSAAVLDVNQYVPGDAGRESQGLLRHTALDTRLADVAAYEFSATLPLRDPFGVVLVRAGRHALR
jgi:hypothetical protein